MQRNRDRVAIEDRRGPVPLNPPPRSSREGTKQALTLTDIPDRSNTEEQDEFVTWQPLPADDVTVPWSAAGQYLSTSTDVGFLTRARSDRRISAVTEQSVTEQPLPADSVTAPQQSALSSGYNAPWSATEQHSWYATMPRGLL